MSIQDERAHYVELRVRLHSISRAIEHTPEDDELVREWQEVSKQVSALAKKVQIATDTELEVEVQRLIAVRQATATPPKSGNATPVVDIDPKPTATTFSIRDDVEDSV